MLLVAFFFGENNNSNPLIESLSDDTGYCFMEFSVEVNFNFKTAEQINKQLQTKANLTSQLIGKKLGYDTIEGGPMLVKFDIAQDINNLRILFYLQ